MNRDHVKGLIIKTKGYVEQLASKITGDEQLLAQGKQDRLAGWQEMAQADVQDVDLPESDRLQRDGTT
jgi:uncharacterized protein YjbJ (UPF0337 family)